MTSLAELGQPSSYEDYQWQKLRKQMSASDFSRPMVMNSQQPGFSALEMFPANNNCQCVGCSIYPRMMSFLGVLSLGQMIIILLLLSRRSNF
jgi:hypothetical protein